MHDFALTVKFSAAVGKHMRPTEDKTSLYRTSYDPFFPSTGIDMRRSLVTTCLPTGKLTGVRDVCRLVCFTYSMSVAYSIQVAYIQRQVRVSHVFSLFCLLYMYNPTPDIYIYIQYIRIVVVFQHMYHAIYLLFLAKDFALQNTMS